MNKTLYIVASAGMAASIAAIISAQMEDRVLYHHVQIIEGPSSAPSISQYPAEIFEIPAVSFALPIDLASTYGMSPKEYGLRYGNGGSKRSNRLRYSHNAKLKRRAA